MSEQPDAIKTEHTHRLRVRYDECDSMGMVHHSNYLRYFEIARTELYRACGGSYRDFEASGLFVVVLRVDCRYRVPARYDDELDICVRVERMTQAKIEQSYQIHRQGSLLATAQVTLAVVDRDGKPQRIPDSIRIPLPKLVPVNTQSTFTRPFGRSKEYEADPPQRTSPPC